MSRDYSQHHHRDPARYDEPDRHGFNRDMHYGSPSRRDEATSNWNDAQTARWLSHYGGASQRGERDERRERMPDYDRTDYTQGYGARRSGYESPYQGRQRQERWEDYAPEQPWGQRGAERIWPAQHGRYGWRGEDVDQGILNFQPGEQDYGGTYGPTFGSTYRQPGHGYESRSGDYGAPSPRLWRDEHWYRSDELHGAYHGRGPTGYTRSDERIREDVCDRLTDDPHVDASAIQVTVESGVVTLQGQVPERQMKHRAEDCAEHISGVKDVENRLRVNRSDAWSDEGEGSVTR